jgi:putative mRNA 3-end processing factor
MAGWLRKFGETSEAFASGWMAVRGARRRRAVDRGFVLSDHADWDGLLSAIAATGAERVDVTHGYTTVLSRWLREQGLSSSVLPTRWEGERAEAGDVEEIEDEATAPPAAADDPPAADIPADDASSATPPPA